MPELTPYLDTDAALKVDASNLRQILADIPGQISRAGEEFGRLVLPPAWSKVAQVVFCGMGGSAIGAEVATDLPPELWRKPLALMRDYRLPAFADSTTLVVVVSYSGETEEALACFAEASARGCPLLAVTGGGKLAVAAEAAGVPCYRFDYQAPPRDAFGYLFAPLVRVLTAAGVLQESESTLVAAVAELTRASASYLPAAKTSANRAKQLAYVAFDHVPLVLGTAFTRGVARRWKNQFNEHAKVAAFSEAFPEANHNTVEGLELPARFHDDAVVFILAATFDHPEVKLRQAILADYLKQCGITHEVIVGQGTDQWSQKLSLVYLGDWVSYYLALLNRVDPEAIPAIMALKRKLRAG